jgi:hypothetical protein
LRNRKEISSLIILSLAKQKCKSVNMESINMESELSESVKSDMRKGAGWIKFFSIVLIVLATLMLGLGMFIMSIGGPGGGMMAIILIILAGVLGFLGSLLLKYASSLTNTADTGNLLNLEDGFNKLKLYFIVMGILTILSALSTVNDLINLG